MPPLPVQKDRLSPGEVRGSSPHPAGSESSLQSAPWPLAPGGTELALSEPAWNLEEERRQGWAVQEQHVEAQGTGLAMTKCHLLHVTQPLWALISTSENNRHHFRESTKGPSDRNAHQARNPILSYSTCSNAFIPLV